MTISDATVTFQGKSFGKLIKPARKIKIGDGESSEKPIINFCTHNLEE